MLRRATARVFHVTLRRRSVVFMAAALLAVCQVALFDLRAQVAPQTLPTRLDDLAFWQMIVDFSEPDGMFRSDNFVSNEMTYQEIIPELKKRTSPEGIYVGVGPDQNFTYITALAPRMAFIIDIRRQNLIQHLLYKALVEMSDDRGDFLARLFSRARPAGLDESAAPRALFEAYIEVPASETLFETNLKEVKDWLVERHGFPLTADDLPHLDYVYRAFFSEGPDLRYSFPRQRAAVWFPTYAQLMMATDSAGVNHSYMASERNFHALRELQRSNLVIPIVGDFAGSHAIRSVGRYLAEHGATVNYFYTSNVEQYLFQNDAYRRFYASVAAMPLNEKSAFIRAYFDTGFLYPPGIVTPDLHSVQLQAPILGFLKAFDAGAIESYQHVIEQSK